jgi:hypothetical protein
VIGVVFAAGVRRYDDVLHGISASSPAAAKMRMYRVASLTEPSIVKPVVSAKS